MKQFLNWNYNTEFLVEVLKKLAEYEELELDPFSIYAFSKKEKEQLEKLQKLYQKVSLFRDYETVFFDSLSKEEIFAQGNEFLIQLFPKRKQEIIDLDDKITFTGQDLSDAGCTYFLTKEITTVQNIILPSIQHPYAISIFVHEKIHALTFQKIPMQELYQYGKEMIPIFIQKIVLNELDQQFARKEDYLSILERTIRWNDFMQANYHLEIAKQKWKQQKENKLYQSVYAYWYLSVMDYLLGECFSELLLKYYQEDQNFMKEKLNQVLLHQITIPEFLENYQINLKNKDLIPTTKKNLEKIKRMNFIL